MKCVCNKCGVKGHQSGPTSNGWTFVKIMLGDGTPAYLSLCPTCSLNIPKKPKRRMGIALKQLEESD